MQNNKIQVNKHERRARRKSANHEHKLRTWRTRVNTYFFLLLVAEDLCFAATLEPAAAFPAFVLGAGAGELGTVANKFDVDANVRVRFKFAGRSRDSWS